MITPEEQKFINQCEMTVGSQPYSNVLRLIDTIKQLQKDKDNAYSERNQLVALISKCFPSWLERHPESDSEWEDDWRWIVFIELPTGQASWHIHDSELSLFDHLKREPETQSWDGHTTVQKYARVALVEAYGHCRKCRCTLPAKALYCGQHGPIGT